MGERQQAGIGEGGGVPANERLDEARRILDRLQREQTGGEGFVRRTAAHLAARDAPENDRIEVWATRAGRALGLLITLAIIAWLLSYLMRV